MVKATLTTYKFNKKNYWKRRKYMFYRSIKNYHYAKLTVVDTVEYTGSSLKFASNNLAYVGVMDILSGCPDFGVYRNLYVSYKLRGIAIQVIPCATTTGFYGGTCMISLLADNEEVSFRNVMDSDQSLVMNPFQFTSKYIKFDFPWNPSNNTELNYGKVALGISSSSPSGACKWTIKFNCYVLYKTNS